jgi:hypothetical protein
MKFKSCAVWPKGCFDALITPNYTEDEHDTLEQAQAVAGMLMKRQVVSDDKLWFPVKTWVEAVIETAKDRADLELAVSLLPEEKLRNFVGSIAEWLLVNQNGDLNSDMDASGADFVGDTICKLGEIGLWPKTPIEPPDESEAEEEATGITESPRGLGIYYEGAHNVEGRVTPGGAALSIDEARQAILEGISVEVPNAGAGSYRAFFESIGFKEVRVVENMSSAGDWTFGVLGENNLWHIATQTNRFPRHGFEYSVAWDKFATEFEDLANFF